MRYSRLKKFRQKFTELGLAKGNGWFLNFLGAPVILLLSLIKLDWLDASIAPGVVGIVLYWSFSSGIGVKFAQSSSRCGCWF
jgi:hypothetical protein